MRMLSIQVSPFHPHFLKKLVSSAVVTTIWMGLRMISDDCASIDLLIRKNDTDLLMAKP